MKIFVASDIHGSAFYCRKMLEAYKESKADRLLLLGDILYHGPRNDLPKEYAPKEVIAMLNPLKQEIYAVRGNCEAEVDQMVLEFPCMADYEVLWDPEAENPVTHSKGQELFFTLGHIWGPGIPNSVDHLPNLPKGPALVYGHTHKKVLEPAPNNPDILCFNPGSVGIPKDGTHSYGIYESGMFRHCLLEAK